MIFFLLFKRERFLIFENLLMQRKQFLTLIRLKNDLRSTSVLTEQSCKFHSFIFLVDECKLYLGSLDVLLFVEVGMETLPSGCLVQETSHEGTQLKSYDGIFNHRRTEQKCTFSTGNIFCVYKVINIFHFCQTQETKSIMGRSVLCWACMPGVYCALVYRRVLSK